MRLSALFLALALNSAALETEMLPGTLVPAAGAANVPLRVTKGQALVQLAVGTTEAQLDALLTGMGATRGVDLGGRWHLVHLQTGQSVATALPILRALPGVMNADPSRVYEANRIPNDPQVNTQYALSQVNAFAAWEYEQGSSSRTTVAVVDVGIDGTHPDLSTKLAATNALKRCFNPNTGAGCADDPHAPSCNHGTRVGGVAAAQTDNGAGVAGMGWNAQLLAIKVFLNADCTNVGCTNGACVTNDAGIIAAINYAAGLNNTAAAGRMVINLSLGGAGGCPAAVQTAVTNAVAAGAVVVASSGNDGAAVNNPANCAGAIPVGATDASNNVASFSSRGTELANSGLVAPGVGVLTTDLGGGYASATGTSFSAPMVAGTAALIFAAKPTFTPAQVSAALRGGAAGIGVSTLGSYAPQGNAAGAGRMDAFRAMRLAVNGTLAGFDGEKKPIAFPNPFRPSRSGTVSFAVPPSLQGAQQVVKIYTMDGILVKELNGLAWDGKNTNGNAVASGTYIFVVSSSAGTGRGRFAVLR